jgi:hypothetical protein
MDCVVLPTLRDKEVLTEKDIEVRLTPKYSRNMAERNSKRRAAVNHCRG